MGNASSCNGRCALYIGGAISGSGIGIMLPATLEQVTNRTPANDSRLMVAPDPNTSVANVALARCARRKTD